MENKEQKYLDKETQEIVMKSVAENGAISILFRDGRVRDVDWTDERFYAIPSEVADAPVTQTDGN